MDNMNQETGNQERQTFRKSLQLPVVSAVLLWLSQPPLSLWLLASVSLIPLLMLVERPRPVRKSEWVALWIGGTLFWLASLEGLRHAHPLMFLGWFALSGYLAVYWLLFVYSARWMHQQRGLPLFLAVAIAWIGQEYLRNHLLTGISACMLGHTMADVPVAMQIANWFGSYGVSLFVVAVNVVCYRSLTYLLIASRLRILKGCCSLLEKGKPLSRNATGLDSIAAVSWITVVLVIGMIKLESAPTNKERSLGRYLLIQRSEPVEYVQSTSRSFEIYQAYARQTLDALTQCDAAVDAVIWPESMYSAGNPWMEIPSFSNRLETDSQNPLAASAAAAGVTPLDLRRAVEESQSYFESRSADLYAAAKNISSSGRPMDFLVGCGVLRYSDQPEIYCGLVQFADQGKVKQWYGKNHLVMFGEYIPIVSSVPLLKRLLPPGMGLDRGSAPEPMKVGDASLLPNICIETAVEHVTVNHLRGLHQKGLTADAVVTVTNDGWFSQSSILEHHLRCAQFVAVGIGRPILSSANNGPTAWIDHHGRVQDRLKFGSHGHLIAEPTRREDVTLYTRIGDWPALFLGLATVLPLLRLRKRRETSTGNESKL